ncbi:MAG: ABC transporter permease subunit [bacterium]|nr:ABC transporter permease subunit [bacterium]
MTNWREKPKKLLTSFVRLFFIRSKKRAPDGRNPSPPGTGSSQTPEASPETVAENHAEKVLPDAEVETTLPGTPAAKPTSENQPDNQKENVLPVKEEPEEAAVPSPVTNEPSKDWLEIREPVAVWLKIVLGAIPIILLFATWALLTMGKAEERVLSPVILPSPWEVLLAIKSLWFDAQLARSLIASTWRIVLGFLFGIFISLPLGVLMGSFSKVKALFDPMTIFIAYLPIPALVPLTMSLFGIDELQKVMFLALAFVIYLLPLVLKAVEDVDNVFLQTAYTMGASKWQIVRRVLFPIAFPSIVNTMRLGFGVGWTYIILAEMVAADRGLGQIIIIAQRRGPREHIYLVLVVIVLVAYITDKLWARLSRFLFPYLEAK